MAFLGLAILNTSAFRSAENADGETAVAPTVERESPSDVQPEEPAVVQERRPSDRSGTGADQNDQPMNVSDVPATSAASTAPGTTLVSDRDPDLDVADGDVREPSPMTGSDDSGSAPPSPIRSTSSRAPLASGEPNASCSIAGGRADPDHNDRAGADHDGRADPDHNDRAGADHDGRADPDHNDRAGADHDGRADPDHNHRADTGNDSRSR